MANKRDDYLPEPFEYDLKTAPPAANVLETEDSDDELATLDDEPVLAEFAEPEEEFAEDELEDEVSDDADIVGAEEFVDLDLTVMPSGQNGPVTMTPASSSSLVAEALPVEDDE